MIIEYYLDGDTLSFEYGSSSWAIRHKDFSNMTPSQIEANIKDVLVNHILDFTFIQGNGTNKMNYLDLVAHVTNIEGRPSAYGTRFGCDCGCGGDFYTIEDWDKGEQLAEDSIETLTKLGIIFPKSED